MNEYDHYLFNYRTRKRKKETRAKMVDERLTVEFQKRDQAILDLKKGMDTLVQSLRDGASPRQRRIANGYKSAHGSKMTRSLPTKGTRVIYSNPMPGITSTCIGGAHHQGICTKEDGSNFVTLLICAIQNGTHGPVFYVTR